MLKSRFSQFALAAIMIAPVAALAPASARAMQISIGVSIGIAPPPLPVYVQPPLPAPGYLWTPGYWAYGDAGYYWVPGVWVQPPSVGLLWTPGYWGFVGGSYGWHGGYWGPHVGFYGGVNYGFGYGGIGFAGGEWRGGGFFYNSAVANFGSTHITNVYNNTTIVHQNTIINNNHVSYNGGNGGINRQPTPEQQQYARETHVPPTQNQVQHRELASQDRGQLASVNHGRPAITAARDNASFRQVAQQNARQNPISAADRQQGRAYRPAQGSVDNREGNQDQRIANGLRSGQMTSGEAARADQRQSAIDQQVHNDRAANGGTLTNAERQQVNREQNGASRQIYNENHNGNTIAPNATDNREANQQQRAANGLRSGQMTAGEAARSNGNQGRVDQQVHNDRTSGNYNRQQRQQVNREQNQNSRQESRENHNGNRR